MRTNAEASSSQKEDADLHNAPLVSERDASWSEPAEHTIPPTHTKPTHHNNTTLAAAHATTTSSSSSATPPPSTNTSVAEAISTLESNEFNNKSTSQMLRELERKKEDLQLKPRPFSDVMDGLMARITQVILKIPPLLWRSTVFLSDRTMEFIRNPLIVTEWAVNIKTFAKKEAKHYWAGGKLFYADLKSAVRIARRVLQGHSLSRREKMQLRRATADILRMVPFLAFVIIPFLELFLPLAIKLFPNMLPSQFEDKLKREEEVRRKLRARLELAKFLQDTVELMVVDLKKNKNAETVATAQELHKFITNIRDGHPVTNEDIVRFAKLFNDELTLDSVDRPQLIAMCRFMDIPPYGSDALLRFHLRNKLRQLKADDRLIYWEGVNSLSMEELMFACQERGMRIGLPTKDLRRQLNEWLQLSLDFNIPSSLLILSRAFRFTSDVDQMNPDEAIKMAIGSLPKNAIDEVLMDQHDDNVSIHEKKLESLRRQEKLIEEEEKAEAEKKSAAQEAGNTEVDEEYLSEYKKTVSKFIDDKSSLRDERRELSTLSGEYETVNDTFKENSEAVRFRKVHEYVGKVIGELQVEFDEAQDDFSNAYHKLDKDCDGLIDVSELRKVNRLLKNKPSDELMEKLIEKLDSNRDGKISVNALRQELMKNARNQD